MSTALSSRARLSISALASLPTYRGSNMPAPLSGQYRHTNKASATRCRSYNASSSHQPVCGARSPPPPTSTNQLYTFKSARRGQNAIHRGTGERCQKVVWINLYWRIYLIGREKGVYPSLGSETRVRAAHLTQKRGPATQAGGRCRLVGPLHHADGPSVQGGSTCTERVMSPIHHRAHLLCARGFEQRAPRRRPGQTRPCFPIKRQGHDGGLTELLP